jgi:trimethylamine--corrinoid protein Co-methyltransferase
MPMAGATAPATLPGCVAISNAEVLSQLVVVQMKYPGAPVVIGSFPSVMDMKTTIFSTGAPELSFMLIALTELGHYYGLPVKGEAGLTDADIVGAQAAAEITYQIIFSALSGADLVHNVGLMYHSTATSPDLIVLADEIIGMVKILMGGMEINSETLPLDLIEQLGPKSSYISNDHTYRHFREFWMPTIFDRSFTKTEEAKDCEELLNQKTIKILKTHEPKQLPDDLVKELKKIEKTWFDRAGLEYKYPRRIS